MSDLVPEDFDLDDALQARSTTPDDQRKACPECTSLGILPKTTRPGGVARTDERPWLCEKCGAHFETPVRGGGDA